MLHNYINSMMVGRTIIIASVLVILNLNDSHAQDKSIFPTSKVGELAKSYFDVFNAGDTVAMKEFITNNRTAAALERLSVANRLGQYQQMLGMLKSLEPRVIDELNSQEITVKAFSSTINTWFDIGFKTTNDSPPKLETLSIRPGVAPSADSGNVEFEPWAALTQLLEQAVDKYGMPGIAIGVIENGKISDLAVSGVRSINSNELIQIDDKFHLGSVTKAITATLIGELVETGKLTFNTTLSGIFPDLEMLPSHKNITVQEILQHTAGFPAWTNVSDEEETRIENLPGTPIQQRDVILRELLLTKSINKSGTWTYSNAGYTILGAIIDKLGKDSYESQLQNVIFDPLQMTEAGTGWPKTTSELDQPSGHYGSLEELTSQEIGDYPFGPVLAPAGNVHASIRGISNFALDHLNGLNGKRGILETSTFKQLHDPGNANPSYAAGWFIDSTNPNRVIHEHSGTAGTFFALMQISPMENKGWIIVANTGDFAMETIFREILDEVKAK
jgi:CubicO group peptidase (beta-lactamase class C family)